MNTARARRSLRWRGSLLAAALAGTALLAGACGGSPHSGTASGNTGQSRVQQLDILAKCIRDHGVPNFYFSGRSNPNSSGTSMSILGYTVTGVDPSTPQFQAAFSACKHLTPGGPPPPMTTKQKEQMLAFAACMRTHGYPTYPDPVFKNGGAEVQQPPGVDQNSPQFQAAMKTCNKAT